MRTLQLQSTESNKLLEGFISNIPFGMAVIDLSGKLKISNELFSEYLGLAVHATSHENAHLLPLVEDIPEFFEILDQCLNQSRDPFHLESLIIGDGYYNINGRLISDGYLITVEDISKQKEMEANSIQAILEGQEIEQRRIGREIHDGIGPVLSYIKLTLESFIDELHKQNPQVQTQVLDNISESIDSITTHLRMLSHNLVPRLLDEFGLNAAFENLVYRMNESKKAGISFYTNMKKETRLDHDLELNLFRCGQELLTNALKYAKAETILVQLILHKESVVLMVEDDGEGFSKENLLPENFGIGLINIDTRVRMLAGEFILDSVTNKGTVASIEIPL